MLHEEEHCDLYKSSSIARIVKPVRLWRAEHVARAESYKECIQKFHRKTSWETPTWKTEKEMWEYIDDGP